MPTRVERSPETSLYATVKAFLEQRGLSAKGEICGCDIVAIRAGEPALVVIAELKMGFSLDLILQGVDRLRIADEVWLAVRQTRKGRDRDRRAAQLCRMLGFGLLSVDPTLQRLEILAEPSAYRPRSQPRRRSRLVQEHQARDGDPTLGGSTRQPIMTAYRQQALACAAALRSGPRRPRDLTPVVPDAGRILLRNVYGWFQRVERGLYCLTESGEAALRRWAPVASHKAPMIA